MNYRNFTEQVKNEVVKKLGEDSFGNKYIPHNLLRRIL